MKIQNGKYEKNGKCTFIVEQASALFKEKLQFFMPLLLLYSLRGTNKNNLLKMITGLFFELLFYTGILI